jgi:anaerobic C4-dicarboxylate transporter
LAAVVVIVVLGLFDQLRPTVTVDDASGPLSMTTVIELVMFTSALVNLHDRGALHPPRSCG